MSEPEIRVTENGPYEVRGGVRIVRRRTVDGASGDPVGWTGERDITPDEDPYYLCRCGHSQSKPFCDGSHERVGFDGTETAPTQSFDELAELTTDQGITLGDAEPLCAHTGFCAGNGSNVWAMQHEDLSAEQREEMRSMIEHCPSGRLAHRGAGDSTWVEPELPAEIVVVGDGQLFVTGGIPVHRADGAEVETRNRVSLCRCGESDSKPLCDGTHGEIGFADA